MIKIAEIQNKVFDYLICYRNDNEELSLPYLKVDNGSYKVCHFLYVTTNEEIKVTQEILYDIKKNTIVREKHEEKYNIFGKINIMKKKICVPKIYDYFDKIFLFDFQLQGTDVIEKETYFTATGNAYNAYLKMAEYFINNWLR